MLSFFAISGILIFTTATIMAVVMLAHRETRLHVAWGAFCVLVAFWGIGGYGVGTSDTPEASLFWWKMGYLGVILIPALFTHFVYMFLDIRSRIIIPGLYALTALLYAAHIFTDSFMQELQPFYSLYYLTPTPLYNLYMAMWIVLVPYTHYLLYRAYHSAVDEQKRQQIEHFFLASFLGFFGGSFAFLPVYGFDLYPYGNIAVCAYPVIMGYAIMKYRLWNLRVIATQAFVAALLVFLLARLILAPLGSQDQWISGIVFLLALVVGVLLVRSVKQEMRQRELIEKQKLDLELANAQQESLLHFISHEIKGYLTKNEAAFASIKAGDFGEISPKLERISSLALDDTRKGVDTVMNILDASNLKKGTMSLSKNPFDLARAVAEMVHDLTPAATERGLELRFVPPTGNFTLVGDEEKIRHHVVRNIIDNSIKYTLKGHVAVELSRAGSTIRFTVSDTGVGLTEDDKKRLFTQGGRGAESLKVNVHSTGYGLFVAKMIVEGHGGHISAESEGRDKGSRFIIDLPAFAA